MKDGFTTIKQWQGYGFRVEEIDPVRTGEAFRDSSNVRGERSADKELSQVFDFFGVSSNREQAKYLVRLTSNYEK
jgi:hypothetical protein